MSEDKENKNVVLFPGVPSENVESEKEAKPSETYKTFLKDMKKIVRAARAHENAKEEIVAYTIGFVTRNGYTRYVYNFKPMNMHMLVSMLARLQHDVLVMDATLFGEDVPDD